MRRLRRRDRGVTIVEAAFALPIFLLFVSGLVDLGMWSMNSNQATNAARDGARVGILRYEDADQPGTADHRAIVDAVLGRLPAGTAQASGVTVVCVDDDGRALPCTDAEPEVDRVRVSVDWAWRLVTPIAGVVGTDRGAVSGAATMLIVGLPQDPGPTTTPPGPTTTTTTTTTAPPSPPTTAPPVTTTTRPPSSSTTTTTAPCSATIAMTPASVGLRSSGRPAEDIRITVTITGGAGCTPLQAQLDLPGAGAVSRSLGSGSDPQIWAIGKNDISGWQTGTGTIRVLRGVSVIGSNSFPVT